MLNVLSSPRLDFTFARACKGGRTFGIVNVVDGEPAEMCGRGRES